MVIASGGCERPRLNDEGEIVWSKNLGGATYGIFSSARGLISSGFCLRDPDINNLGEIIWRFGDGGQGPNGVESNMRGTIFTSSGQDPYYDDSRINNNGEIVCARMGGSQTWSNIRGNLPTYGWYDRNLAVNNAGEVVCSGYNGPTGYTFDIYSTVRFAITNDNAWNWWPDINNNGEIVWWQLNPDGSGDEIWSNIRGKISDGEYPSINDMGEVVWSGWDGTDYEIYSSTRGQLTFNTVDDLRPQINNIGEVAWLRGPAGEGDIVYIPEPATLSLLALGGLALLRRSRRK